MSIMAVIMSNRLLNTFSLIWVALLINAHCLSAAPADSPLTSSDDNLSEFDAGKQEYFGDINDEPLKRNQMFHFGLGKRDPEVAQSYSFSVENEDPMEQNFYPSSGVRKRVPLQGEKDLYSFGLGKRKVYSFGVGKRRPMYSFGVGKRSAGPDLDDAETRNDVADFRVDKYNHLGISSGALRKLIAAANKFDSSKRASSPGFSFGIGKRSHFGFGLGKRADVDVGGVDAGENLSV